MFYLWPPEVGDDDLLAATLQDRRYGGGPRLAVSRLHGDVCPDELRGQGGGIAEVDGAPVAVVQVVRPPTWERIGGPFDRWGSGGVGEHALAFEGGLDGGANPGAGVDVPLGAQAGEGVVEVWRETDQQ